MQRQPLPGHWSPSLNYYWPTNPPEIWIKPTGQEILKILRTLNQEHRLTIATGTHDQTLASQAENRPPCPGKDRK